MLFRYLLSKRHYILNKGISRKQRTLLIKYDRRNINIVPVIKLIIRMVPIVLPFIVSAFNTFRRTKNGQDFMKSLHPAARKFLESISQNANPNKNDNFGYGPFDQSDFGKTYGGSNFNYQNGQYKNQQNYYEHQKQSTKKVRKDYYNILGLQKNCSKQEIKRAYNLEVKKYHPDRNPNAAETERKKNNKKFRDAVEAYTVLMDDTKRREYDLQYF
ncbi:DnaJ subfamily C member 7 [Bonamia ostreae]|uniref:DnaJ subfamily C member 7 n=1 Tax=Bonamia ostreae TaxID=126728 RepID=A0ABV2AIG6_9EUKA